MTSQPHRLDEKDMLVSSRRSSSPPTYSETASEETSSDLKEGLTSFFGGLSGLLFAVSLIFLLQAPLISGGIILALISGWGGTAFFKSRQGSTQS